MKNFLCFLFALVALAQPTPFVFDDQNGEPMAATANPIVADGNLFAQKHSFGNGTYVAKVGLRAIWYADHQTGEVKRINTALSSATDSLDGEAAYESLANMIQYRCNANGFSTFRCGPYILRTKFVRVRIENDATSVLRKQDTTTRPSSLDLTSGTTVRLPALLPYVRYESVVDANSIKENLIVTSVPDGSLTDAEAVLFVFAYDTSLGAALTPSINATTKDIEWKNNSGNIIFYSRAPFVFDAANNTANSRYVLRAAQSLFAVAVPARAMRLATYPVTIDPKTSTVQADCTANRYSRETATGSHDIYKYSWIKFTLPDLTGYQIDDAYLYLWIATYDNPPDLVADVYFDVTGAWTEASSRTTLEALSFNTATQLSATEDGNALGGFDGLTAWRILGGIATGGARKIYNDDSSPSPGTVKITYTGTASTDTVGTGVALGEESYDYVGWSPRSDATSFPSVVIWYSDPTGVKPSRRNPGVGMIN